MGKSQRLLRYFSFAFIAKISTAAITPAEAECSPAMNPPIATVAPQKHSVVRDDGACEVNAELEAVAGGYSFEEFASDLHCVFYLLLATSR